jgi:hypothetical protein
MTGHDKFFRCGWCGFPTDSTGEPLKIPDYDQATEICGSLENRHQVDLPGDCCAEYAHQEENQMRVTRDMAMDAGDMSLEGHWI